MGRLMSAEQVMVVGWLGGCGRVRGHRLIQLTSGSQGRADGQRVAVRTGRGQLTGGGWGREGDGGAPGMELSTGSQTSAVPSAASWLSLNDAWPTSVRPVMGESKIHRSRAWRGNGWKCGCDVPVW